MHKPAIRIAFLFLFAVAVQAVFLAVLPDTMRQNDNSDYFSFYAPLAHNLADGGGFVVDDHFSTRYPPGFSLYLAPQFYLAEHSGIPLASVITSANVLASALGCVLLYCLVRLILTENIALMSALLWATYPFNLWLSKQPNSEVPFIPVFFFALVLFLRARETARWPWFAAAGFFAGIAALVRPIAALVAVLLALAFLLHRHVDIRRRLACSGLLIAAFAIAILPWEALALSHTGALVPLSSGGMPTFLNGLTFNVKGPQGAAWVPAGAQSFIRRVQQHRSTLDNPHTLAQFLGTEFRDHPGSVLQLTGLKTLRSWYGADSLLHERAIAAVQLGYLLIVIPGVWLAWRRFPQSRWPVIILLLIILYFWGVTLTVLSILRYMVPIMGFALMFAAVTLDAARSRWVPGHIQAPFAKTLQLRVR